MVIKPFRTRDQLREDSERIHANSLRRDSEIRATPLKKFQETYTPSLRGPREEYAFAETAKDAPKLDAH
jgi:hypothetical protein